MSEAQTESPPVTNRWVRISIAAPPEGVDVEMTEDGLLWRTKPRKVVQVFQSAPDPEADAARIAAKQEQQFERHVIEWAKGQYLALFEQAEEAPPAEPAPEHRFPASLDEKLGDYGTPPDELTQLMQPGEELAAAVERMTPGLDELLDMATVISQDSLNAALATIAQERANEWTERLAEEKARLRLKRGTTEENLARENLIQRVANTFARVGAKR